jgi:hypothetical protein
VIKIQQFTHPIVWQVNTDHLLPATSGQVRWNGQVKQLEVCDNQNGTWYKIDNTVELKSDPDIGKILHWAKKKMEYDQKIEELANQYPAVKDAKEKLDIILKLVQNEIV